MTQLPLPRVDLRDGSIHLVVFLIGLGFVGLATAVVGVFTPWVLVVALVGSFALHRSLSTVVSQGHVLPRWSFLIAILPLLSSIPPGELIPGGWDPGVYLQTAVQLSEQGSLTYDHPDLLAVRPEVANILFRDVHGIPEPFGGMRLTPEGKVTPQFYHVYPVLLAVIFGFTGSVSAMLYLNPLLGCLNTLLVMRVTTCWTNSVRWSVAAGLFYALNPIQLWQTKFCTAEMLTQTFLLGGWVLLSEWDAQSTKHRLAPVLAGLSFGMAVLTRYDSIMLVILFLPILGLSAGFKRYRAGVLYLLLGAAPCLPLWIFHQQVAPYYRPLRTIVGPLFLVGLGLAFLGVLLATRFPVSDLWVRFRTKILWAVTVGWVIVMGLFWRVRPWISTRSDVAQWIREEWSAGLVDALFGPAKVSMLYFESTYHAVGLGLILLLVPVLWWRANSPGRFAFAISGAVIWVVLAWNPMNDLFMMWVTRRFVPVVIPWTVVGTAVGCATLQGWCADRGKMRCSLVPSWLFILLILLLLPQAWFQVRTRDWPGALAWFEETANAIPDEFVVLTDQPGFGSPLRFLWGKQAFELRRQNPELFRNFLNLHGEEPFSEKLMILTTSDMLTDEPGWVNVQSLPMHSSIQAHHRYKFPRSTKSRGGKFVLYQWTGEERSD